MKKSLLSALLVFSIALTGCVSFNTSNEPAPAVGGIYKSADRGDMWTPHMLISTPQAQKLTIEGVNITTIAEDPQDSNALYIGTEANGLFFSYDNAQSWQQFESLSQGFVQSIAVHPNDKCTIYASIQNRVLRSDDCSRTWNQVYFDPRTDATINSIALDSFNDSIIYAGTSYGDVLQSKDGGQSWTAVNRLNARIVQILIGPDTRTVYVATEYNGIYKTTDKGQTWSQLINSIFEAGADPGLLGNMAFDYKNNVLIISTNYGLLRTRNGGDSWEIIPLLTAPNEVQIHSLAVNPENANEIYYGTDNTFYKTLDGGNQWISQQLPTASRAEALHVNSENQSLIYIGFRKFQQ